jgi:hypothetical protein
MDQEERALREEYFEGPASDWQSWQQFAIQNGRPDLAKTPGKAKGGKIKKRSKCGLARRKRS